MLSWPSILTDMLSLGYETSVNKVGRGGTGRGRGQLRMKALFGLRRGKINHRKKNLFLGGGNCTGWHRNRRGTSNKDVATSWAGPEPGEEGGRVGQGRAGRGKEQT